MKLVTIECREVSGRPGVLIDDDWILDLVAAPRTMSESQWVPLSVISILAAGAEGRSRTRKLIEAALSTGDEQRAALRESGVLLPAADTALMPSLRRPGLVLMATADREPNSWARNPNAVTGDDARVAIPWSSDKGVSVSVLPVAVFGKPLYAAAAQEAAGAVAAWTIMLDFARGDIAPDQDLEAWRRHVRSRQFPGSCSIGALATVDEVDSPESLRATLSVNGVEIASDALFAGAVAHSDVIAALSREQAFRPGDLVAFEPAPGSALRGQPLQGGDRIGVTAPGLGSLNATIYFPHDQ